MTLAVSWGMGESWRVNTHQAAIATATAATAADPSSLPPTRQTSEEKLLSTCLPLRLGKKERENRLSHLPLLMKGRRDTAQDFCICDPFQKSCCSWKDYYYAEECYHVFFCKFDKFNAYNAQATLKEVYTINLAYPVITIGVFVNIKANLKLGHSEHKLNSMSPKWIITLSCSTQFKLFIRLHSF